MGRHPEDPADTRTELTVMPRFRLWSRGLSSRNAVVGASLASGRAARFPTSAAP
jgi:hypothetical protein